MVVERALGPKALELESRKKQHQTNLQKHAELNEIGSMAMMHYSHLFVPRCSCRIPTMIHANKRSRSFTRCRLRTPRSHCTDRACCKNTSDNAPTQSYVYPCEYQRQSSFFEGWNEDPSAFTSMMPTTHREKEEVAVAATKTQEGGRVKRSRRSHSRVAPE
eukprot:scaffold1464_cov208-Skeletonema_marinoi.AAC.3